MIPVMGQAAETLVPPSTSQNASNQLLVSTPTSAALESFANARRALLQQRQALVAQGASQEELAAWQQQNAAQFVLLQQQAQALGAGLYLQTHVPKLLPSIPAGASQTLTDFMTTRAALLKGRAQIHNQLVHQALAAGQATTVADVQQLEQQEMRAYQQTYGATLELQAQRAQVLANEASHATATGWLRQHREAQVKQLQLQQAHGDVSTGLGINNQ